MSHFYGTMKGTRGGVTRCGDAHKGLSVTAASWNGAITVALSVDAKTGKDTYHVYRHAWKGQGTYLHIVTGTFE